MELFDEKVMGRHLGRIAGVAALGLVIGRATRLFEIGPGVPPWAVILASSAVLGAVTWWLLTQAFTRARYPLLVFSVAVILLVSRIAVPETLILGLIPGAGTAGSFVSEMQEAIGWIRDGVPPIIPIAGVIAILSGLMFVAGALYAWGLRVGSTPAMVIPSLVIYLQFAVFDRKEAGLGWMAAAAGVIALGVAAAALDGRTGAGRARNQRGDQLPRKAGSLALATATVVGAIAVVAANSAAGLVPDYGAVPGGSGVARLFGGGASSFDRWVDLRQSVLNPTGRVVFTAQLGEGAPPASRLYWRMEALDSFNGTEWNRSSSIGSPYDLAAPLGDASDRYQGTTVEVTQVVRIESLRTGAGISPTAGVPIEVRAAQRQSGSIPPSEFVVLPGSSLAYPPLFKSGDFYEVVSAHPDVSADLGALASDGSGALSPMFAAAAEAGLWNVAPSPAGGTVTEPGDLARLTELPAATPPSIVAIARTQTAGAETDFERAWMLQHWFRDSGEFEYSTDVTTGHRSLDLAAWLTNPESINYRKGYCEQFAASMAVLARSLGIASRVVWGFTPGTEADGRVVVRDSNAHAWVEVWIDGFGWVPFEPTPRSDFVPASITDPFDPDRFVSDGGEEPSVQPPPHPATPPAAAPGSGPGFEISPLWIALLVVSIGAVPASKRVRRWRRVRQVEAGSATAVWDEIVDRLSDLGEPVVSSLTPIEFADRTDKALVGVATRYSEEIYGGRSGLGRPEDLTVTEAWLRERFGPIRRIRAAMSPRSFLSRD